MLTEKKEISNSALGVHLPSCQARLSPTYKPNKRMKSSILSEYEKDQLTSLPIFPLNLDLCQTFLLSKISTCHLL